MIFRLQDDDFSFPNPDLADSDGLIAIEGDLKPQRLINAYKNGIFPWPHKNYPLLWFSPQKRAILYPKNLKVSCSLKKSIRKYKVKINNNFEATIRGCAESRKNSCETWISEEMIQAYLKLHEMGVAHSIESYFENRLIGGLYGLNFGNIFCGESMFSKKNDASKVALFTLCQKILETDGFIDAQVQNDHLKTLGFIEIPRKEYLNILHVEIKKQNIF